LEPLVNDSFKSRASPDLDLSVPPNGPPTRREDFGNSLRGVMIFVGIAEEYVHHTLLSIAQARQTASASAAARPLHGLVRQRADGSTAG
jgi:hypothetical protein